MESLKNVYCEKMGLFRFLAEKIFSVAALECDGLLRGVPGGFGVRVDGRSWARVDGRSWARVDGCDGGCACLI